MNEITLLIIIYGLIFLIIWSFFFIMRTERNNNIDDIIKGLEEIDKIAEQSQKDDLKLTGELK